MYRQEIFLILAAVVAVTNAVDIPPEMVAYVKDIHKTCMEKTGTPDSAYNNFDIKNNPHDSAMQCYFKCLLLQSTWMSPEGEIRYDFIVDSAHPDLKDHLVAITSKCKTIEEGANLCEKASNFNQCLYLADPEKWILI